MKKVMFMIESMVVGGAEKALIDLVNNLDPKKYDVTVIYIFKHSVYPNYSYKFKQLFNGNINLKYLINNSNKLKYRCFNFLYNKLPKAWFYKVFIKEKYDIEVAFYEGFPTTFLSYSNNKNSKKVAWLHTDSNNAFVGMTNEQLSSIKNIYKKYDLIVGVSKAVCKSFYELFGMKDRLRVQYNVIDIQNIIKQSNEPIDIDIKEDRIKLISVGRLNKVKGYDRLLKVCKKLKENKFTFELWIVGEGDERNNLQKYIDKNNLNEYIKLLGFQDNPYKYISKSDIFVCSSRVEGYSLVIAEAIILQKPIVAAKSEAFNEIFGNNECGLITENSEEGLYNGISKLMQDIKLIEKYKQESIKRSECFNINKVMKDIENIL